MLAMIGALAPVAFVVALVAIVLAVGYVKAPPDKAYIISGLRKSKRIIGKAAVRVPFFERLDKLDLAVIPVNVRTSSSVPTHDYINVQVDSVVNIKIPTKDVLDGQGSPTFYSEDLLVRAQQNFLNQPPEYISEIAREVLEGNIREIIGQMRLEEMVTNRQRFAELVKNSAAPDLAELGLAIISFNVQNFNDATDTIANLGIDNIERIRKDASIAKANAKRDVEIAEAKAAKEANDARIIAELEIARKNTDLEIKRAELQREADTQKAIAESAHKIQTEKQRKIIEIDTADANIAKQEKDVELAEQQARIQERQLEAEVNKKADAQRYKEQQEADAHKYSKEKAAEAELVVARNKAEAEKVRAEAARYASEQEAEAIRAKGLAEAEAIKAKGLAEAAGLDAEAEAMKKMEQAAVIKTIMEKLPEIAKEIAQPLSKVDSITMYGEGNTTKMVSDLTKSVNQVTNGLTDSLGIDLQELISSIVKGKVIGSDISKVDTPYKNLEN